MMMTDEETDGTRAWMALQAERDEAACRADRLAAQCASERREAQHRMRNVLAVVRSLARRAGDDAASVEEYQAILDGRLGAFFRVQAALASFPERGLDLAGLVSDEFLRFGLRDAHHITLDGEPIRVSGRAAGWLALIFHELSDDLARRVDIHADARLVSVSWRQTDEGVELTWAEDDGKYDGADDRSRPIDWIEQALLYEVDGRIAVDRHDGHRVVITLPATALVTDED